MLETLRKHHNSTFIQLDEDFKRDIRWRPISLLCVLYMLLSTVLVNRLKRFLDILTLGSQCGFIKGHYIGEVTRLVYDIMNCTENSNIGGLLMLIDFEKAFDSISWSFMYNVLEYMGFDQGFIK